MNRFKTTIGLDPHHFYDFDPLHVIVFSRVKGNRSFDLIDMGVQSMFKIYRMERKGKFVGLAFQSAMQVINNGCYLVTFMQKTRMKAEDSSVLIRTQDIIVYNYPNVGALAISPRLSPYLATMFEEQ